MAKYDVDISRLAHTVKYARLGMRVFREERVRCVRRLAGNRYSEQASRKKTFINLIALYTSIMTRNLVPQTPRVLLTTFNRQIQPTLSALQDWANPELERIDFQGTLRRAVLDALTSVGIVKTCIATPADAANFAWNLQAGMPYASTVDLDDFVFDLHARNFDEVSFIGHRFRAPMATIKDDKRFNAKMRAKLVPSHHNPFNAEGDERIEMLGRGYKGFDEELEDMVDLWEIYCPRHRCVYTLIDDGMGLLDDTPLLEQDWTGPDTGPYRTLAFNLIPGNPFPKGPMLDLVDLDEAANHVYRKLVRQAQDAKRIVGAMTNEDVERINKTDDGSGCLVTRPNDIKQMEFGGVDQNLFVLMKELIQRFSWLAGNLETIGGLAPQANTLGQEELLAKQSNGLVAGMQDATTRFAASIVQDLLWYHWNHPTSVQQSSYAMPGTNASIAREIHPWNAPPELEALEALKPLQEQKSIHRRTAPWAELGIKIDPYSMQYQTPQQRAKTLTEIVTQIYAPMAQVAMQQGTTFDFQEFMALLGRYTDQPDLAKLFPESDPMPQDGQGSPGGMDGAPEKTTNIVRHSAGGGSMAAKEAAQTSEMSRQPSNNQLQGA